MLQFHYGNQLIKYLSDSSYDDCQHGDHWIKSWPDS